ncbi:MAG TPA: ATPase P [Erysipelotrichaceae bacterium]|jgi:copper chaperone CopZ|nr:ATPase P [Erysipelotrichaceae bacterium]
MATIIIFALIVLGVIFGLSRMRKEKTSGCCASSSLEKEVKVSDRNLDHYPYKTLFVCEDMICENCTRHVANTLNKFDDTYATANLQSKQVTVYTKQKPDVPALQRALSQAGYPARLMR